MKSTYEKIYLRHKGQVTFHHNRKGVTPFDMSFEDWLEMWMQSGHWENRGRLGQQYCMAKIDYSKPLTKDNAHIITNSERTGLLNRGKFVSEHTRELMREKKLGVPKSDEHRKNMSLAARRVHHNKGHNLAKPLTEE